MLTRNLHWLCSALLLPIVNAQTVTQTETATAASQTFVISVGKGNHQFSPDVVQANPGDIIEFQFFPPNHSVVRADYLLPCIPYEMTGARLGFFSGFRPVDAILENPPTWQLQINDTDPVFFYCSAPGSCTDWGMVGVINPNATTSIQTQRDLAMNASFQLNPGEPFPDEATSTSIPAYTSTVTPTPPPTTATAPPAETTSAEPTSSNASSGLSTGAIAGIAIGGAAVLLIAGFLIWYCGRQSRQNQNPPTTEAPPNYVPPTYGNYGSPMSPAAKHLSGVTVSTTPTQPSPGYPPQHYPYTDPAMGPFGAVQASSPHHAPQQYFTPQPGQMSPRSAAFGGSPLGQPHNQVPLGMQMSENPMQPTTVEADSDRGNSPSPRPQNASGIEAFLARQGRMSPSNSGTNTGSGVGSDSGDGPAIRGPFAGPTGPYEMSASGTNTWRT